MKILCDAISFGYGPVGKLLAISPFLPDSWSLTLLASNSSYALAKKSNFNNIILCDTESVIDLHNRRSLFLESDLFVNIMNPISVKFAKQIGTPIATIDSLFWMWHELTDELLGSQIYYIQNFFGIQSQLQKYKPQNEIIVGPIVDPRFITTCRTNQLLIALGGLRSKLIIPGENTNYPHIIGEILSVSLSSHTFDKVVVVGDAEAMLSSRYHWKIPRATYLTLSHEDFLLELSKSSLLLTSPGLTTIYEAFSYGIPTIFLPPQNFSQFLILNFLKDAGVAPYCIRWEDFYPELEIYLGLPEAEGVQRILLCIASFQNDKRSQQKAIDYLSTIFQKDNWQVMARQQSGFVEKMGSNGSLAIADDLVKRFGS